MRLALLCLLALGAACAQDADRDGLADALEQELLAKFAPSFHIGPSDCDVAPAEFEPGALQPKVKARNGTIYGQAFSTGPGAIELHYYHLWGADCGLTAHPLDAESVAALLRNQDGVWRAAFWYAAAHENTLCDRSNGAAAHVLGAVDRGPDVWISRNKHASYLAPNLCTGGCGQETCDAAAPPLRIAQIVNLGEMGAPMNGADWLASAAWPLASKMTPRFTPALLARMPEGDAPEAVPARTVARGTHGTLKVAARTYGSLVAADQSTGNALDAADRRTSNALGAAAGSVRRSLKRTFEALRPH
ncbi:MAG: hypothetical protein ACM336_15985 [Acidobacteriota bacterium]